MKVRAAFKLLRALMHLLRGIATLALVFPRLTPKQREARVQSWSAHLLACLGLQLRVVGAPPQTGPLLLACNHISWLDITAVHAACYCRFVSKAEVRHWPVIGWLATGIGTLFIERSSRRDAMRIVHQMAHSLQGGDVLAIFPEGTTSDGQRVLPFHANLFQAAISANAPSLPVAIQLRDAATGVPSLAPLYIGDDSLLGSVWRTLCTPGIEVVVRFGAAQSADLLDRRGFAAAIRNQVLDLLAVV